MKDLNGYILRMENALDEKIAFTKHIDINDYDLIVDFGCANGALLRKLRSVRPLGDAIGYDNSIKMIDAAKSYLDLTNNFYTSDLSYLILQIKFAAKSLIIFSSVLHEVDQKTLDMLGIGLTGKGLIQEFDAVVIRDMYWDHSERDAYLYPFFMEKIREKVSPKMLADYEKRWRPLTLVDQNFYHFLLKYTYIDNWETELDEFYFNTPWGEFELEYCLDIDFKIFHDRKYTLPFKKAQVFKDFGFMMELPTHREMILVKKETKHEIF